MCWQTCRGWSSCTFVAAAASHFLLALRNRISVYIHFIGIRLTYGKGLSLAAHGPRVALPKTTKHPADSPRFQAGSQHSHALLKKNNPYWNALFYDLVWRRKLFGLLEAAVPRRLSVDDFTGRKRRASRCGEQLTAHSPEQTRSLPRSAQGKRLSRGDKQRGEQDRRWVCLEGAE